MGSCMTTSAKEPMPVVEAINRKTVRVVELKALTGNSLYQNRKLHASSSTDSKSAHSSKESASSTPEISSIEKKSSPQGQHNGANTDRPKNRFSTCISLNDLDGQNKDAKRTIENCPSLENLDCISEKDS